MPNDTQLVRHLTQAMQEYHRMRAEGVSHDDVCRGLEAIVREVFPLSKYPPRCLTCDDTGLRDRTCWAEQRCGRQKCIEAHPSLEHAYVVPCDCPAGDKFRRKAVTDTDQLAQVGKVTRKPRSFSRFGA